MEIINHKLKKVTFLISIVKIGSIQTFFLGILKSLNIGISTAPSEILIMYLLFTRLQNCSNIDIDDACLRRHVLVTTLRCW